MVEIRRNNQREFYELILDTTETIEILINGNSVFLKTVAVDNKAQIKFEFVEALATEIDTLSA